MEKYHRLAGQKILVTSWAILLRASDPVGLFPVKC